eukprot:COSAG01_NODE_19337_length_1016_cov_1.708833_1_plen_315_part_10
MLCSCSVYTPGQPWAPGLMAGANPRRVHFAGENAEWRPKAMIEGADGKVYIGSSGLFYAFTTTGQLKWTFDGSYVGNTSRNPRGPGFQSSAVVGPDGTVYIGSDDGHLYAVTPMGHLKWKFATQGGISSTPALDKDGTVYVGSSDKGLYAVTSKGTLKWRFPMGDGSIFSSPALDPRYDAVYIGSDDYYLYAVNASSGKQKWKFQTGVMSGTPVRWVRSSPTISASGTVFTGTMAPFVYALDPRNGVEIWNVRTKGPVVSSVVLVPNGSSTLYPGIRCDDPRTPCEYAFVGSGCPNSGPWERYGARDTGNRLSVI